MKLAIPTLTSRLDETRRVECDGFYDGAHGTPLETGIEEIDGKFEEKKANLQKDAVTNQKRLEAEIQHLDEIGPAVERKIKSVEEKNGDEALTVVFPVVVVILALVALISESLLLAPAMDILNVTNEVAQLLTAFGLAAVAGLTFHFVWESFTSDAFPKIWKVTIRTVAAMLAFGLIIWGVLRGYQVAFSASLNQNPLGDFLSGHPILSSIFFVFITLATPVIAATATHYGAHRIQRWREWKTAKAEFKQLSKRRSAATKELEAQEKSLQLGLKALAEEGRQWKSAYSVHHQRGQLHGAKQEAYWIVIAKATFAALVALLAAGWFIFFISPFFFLFPVVAWWAAFLHFRRQWRAPSRVEFFDLEHVQFLTPAKDAHAADVRVSTLGRFRQNDQRGRNEN
jgi:Skp family chaperone for outer membrane proteins